MPPKKRGGHTRRGSAAKALAKGEPSEGAESNTADKDGEISSLIPALRPVTPIRRSSSRAGSEVPKQVRIKSPTPSRTPPFIGGIVGQASPERIRSSQSYEQLLGSPSPSAPTKPMSRQSAIDSPPSPSFSDLPTVGEWDPSSDAASEVDGPTSLHDDLSSDAEPPSPSLDHLPIVGEVDSNVHGALEMDASLSMVGEHSDMAPLSPSLPTTGEWTSDVDGGSEMSGDGGEAFSDIDSPSPTLSDLPIVGEWTSFDAGAESAPVMDELLSDTDGPSPSLDDLPVVGEWVLDPGDTPSGAVESGSAKTMRKSVLKVQETALSLQTSPFPTLPADWGLYQRYLILIAEGRVKRGECSN